MDQNQPSVDNDLQKAIDDITNTTNSDPVFSDPVAAPSSIPEGDTGELSTPVGPFPEPKVEITPPAPEPIAPLDAMSAIPDLAMPDQPAPAPEPQPTPQISVPTPEPIPQSLSTTEIKKAALRDLVPLIEKISMDPTQKFDIYRDIFENLKDYTTLDPAYRTAREIPDETKRAEALLYLVESIDKM
ncbi:hypothetical protein IKE82_01475 [Candidatus Saccharibacteria bacterium]|nr:hypothetical protein [Candidatus Saccharibacteria bacterium]